VIDLVHEVKVNRSDLQRAALSAPLVGRERERVQIWQSPPWTVALSFNR